MDILKPAVAGTLESCDAAVTVEPRPAGSLPLLELVVESSEGRFAAKVGVAARAALAELGVTRAKVTVRDRSALDCTIRARVLAACLRGAEPACGAEPVAKAAAPWEALK